MNYISVQFALFLCAAVLGYYLCPQRQRPFFLLVASYAFYVVWSPLAAVGLFGATVFTYLIAPLVAGSAKTGADAGHKRAMALSVTLLLIYLGFFKALAPLKSMLPESAAQSGFLGLFQNPGMLPLGISYYIFKLVSYVVDVYWGTTPPEKNFINFATYASFFPQIVAGPIQRSGDFLKQVRQPSPSPAMMASGFQRLLLGCFKKTVIADNLGSLISLAYTYPHPAAVPSTLLAFYLFPFQLYADFSALTDIAVGTGRLFGIQSPENFNFAFSASSITDFWKRWHMTLTSWLADYVFMPLRMATRRAGNWGLAFSLMVNMILIGLWHSLTWTFLVSGVVHGIYLTVDALTLKRRSKFFKTHPGWGRAAGWMGTLLTFHLVAFALVFVRAESLAQSWNVYSRLAAPGFSLHLLFESRETIYALAGLALWGVFELAQHVRWPSFAEAPVWGRWAFYYSVIAIIIRYGHNAKGFIYFKF